MKRYLFLLILLIFCSTAQAKTYWYNATSLTGGSTGALDAINGQNLADGDKCIVVAASGQTWIYNLDSDSALSEDSTNYSVVSPDSNAGNKRWILAYKGGRTVLPDSTVDTCDNSIAGTLAWHVAAISTNPDTITLLPGTYDCSTDLTVGSTIDLDFKKGALIAPSSTDIEVTVYSPENIIAGPRQQIVDTSNNSSDPLMFTKGGVVYPGWWNAKADGSTDDTTAIQCAVKTGENVLFPTGRYIITSTITVDTTAQGLFGESSSLGGKSDAAGGDYGAIIEFSIADGAAADEMFLVQLSRVTFKNLKIIGDAGNTNDIGIKFEATSNTDDMDGYVIDCELGYLKQPIYSYGRGLQVDRCVFVSIGSNYAITLNWPSSGETGDDLATADLYKGRGIRITNNRFHSGTQAIQVLGYSLRSPVISNNQCDITTGLLNVSTGGGILGGTISGNIVDLSSQASIKFDEDTECYDLNIVGNHFGGAIAGTVAGTDRRPYAHILFDAPTTIENLNIVGNTFNASDASAIEIWNNAAGDAPTTFEGVNIVGNMFNQIGLDGTANRRIFRSVFDLSNLNFSNNIITNAPATAPHIISTDSKTITGIVVLGNIYDTANVGPFYLTTLAGMTKVNGGSGTATIANGNTSIVVTHGIDYTPDAGDIMVNPIETLNNASFFWVDTITSTQFTINVDADPGQDVDFAWKISKE